MQVFNRSCVRCQGDLARVEDIGDTYYSCVQCGNVVYRLPAAAVVVPPVVRSPELVSTAYPESRAA